MTPETIHPAPRSMDTPSLATRIQPRKGWFSLNLGELRGYSELLYFLAWRDVKVRYKQTALGAAWAILQPLLAMAIFSVFFGKLAGLSRQIPGEIPYPIFAFCGLLPWQLFTNALTNAGNSLVANQNLITKVYFPRLMIPLATLLAGLVDFAIAFIVLIGLMIFYGVVPSLAILSLPLFVLLAVATALAVGLWLSALNVEFRDVRHMIPFLTQIWLFLTPIVYPSTLLPEAYRWLLGFNPMAGVVEGFRWALIGAAPVSGAMLAVSVGMVGSLLVGGLIYFRRMERTFADVV